jgi:hypothetical protein|tara:strand:+ start:5975 stop:6985 length:1011 start_codon:yes stop_codon:yes gene_type:complete
MKRFFKKLGWFALPCFAIVALVICLDFFKVFSDYEEYYSDDLFVSLNREYICFKNLEKQAKLNKPDSFVFGSSRSQAFKCKDWQGYLTPLNRSFHFDAGNEAIVGVLYKLKYLDRNDFKINNVLLVLDVGLLNQTSLKHRNYSLNISHPEISDNSYYDFYKPFITASLNPKFVFSYFDFRTFGKHRKYMGQYIANTKYPMIMDESNMEIYYGKDLEIENDSIEFYKRTIKTGIFYDRSEKQYDSTEVNPEMVNQFQQIKSFFEKYKTSYKFVVSPMYDQIELNKKYLSQLIKIFGKDNVFDYSGENQFTNSLGNFYEISHYRPHVARQILKEIYNN